MKNKILLSLLASSAITGAAMADMYMGVEYGAANNTTTQDLTGAYNGSFEGDNNYKDVKFKLGGGTNGEVKFQGTLSLISYDETVFDDTNKDLIEFGFDIIKEFEVTPSFYPFLKIGIGAGTMDVVGYTEDSMLGVSVNVGAGVSYKVVDHLYLLAGVDYVARKWQDIEYYSYYYGTTTVSTKDSAVKPYVGVNYQF